MGTAAPDRSAVLCSRMHQGYGGYSQHYCPSTPASRLRSATRDVSFLRSDSRCRRYVSDLSNVTLRYLGSGQKGRVSLVKFTISSCRRTDHCKERMSLCHMGLVKDHGGHLVKQTCAGIRQQYDWI